MMPEINKTIDHVHVEQFIGVLENANKLANPSTLREKIYSIFSGRSYIAINNGQFSLSHFFSSKETKPLTFKEITGVVRQILESNEDPKTKKRVREQFQVLTDRYEASPIKISHAIGALLFFDSPEKMKEQAVKEARTIIGK